MSPLWTHSLLFRHAGSAPPGPIRTVCKEKLILKLFRNEVVSISRLAYRSGALRSRENDRKKKRVPKCRNINHSGQIGFSRGRNTLLEVFVEKQSSKARWRQRDKQGDYFQGEEEVQQQKKSLEFLWGAGRISWSLQQQQTGLQLSDDFLPCAPPA